MKSRTATVLLLWTFLCISLLSSQFTTISLFSYNIQLGDGPSNCSSCWVYSFLRIHPSTTVLSLDCRHTVTSSYRMGLPLDCPTVKRLHLQTIRLKGNYSRRAQSPSGNETTTSVVCTWREHLHACARCCCCCFPCCWQREEKYSPRTGKTLKSSLVFSL